MKKWKILMLGLGYLAGMLVALKFGKDGKDKDMSELWEDFKNIHKNLWTEAESQVFTPENRERVAELKDLALAEITEFKNEAEKEIKKLIKEGNLKKAEITDEIKKLYDHREEMIDQIVEEAQALAETVKSESEETGNLLSKKIDSIAKDLKKELQGKFNLLKKKIK